MLKTENDPRMQTVYFLNLLKLSFIEKIMPLSMEISKPWTCVFAFALNYNYHTGVNVYLRVIPFP